MGRDEQITFSEYRMTTGEHGGPRLGAGRPAGNGSEVPHLKRPVFKEEEPAFVTMRIRKGISSLRVKKIIKAVRRTLREVLKREDFRVALYSIQSNHLHLIVEAEGSEAMANGMNAVASRIARVVNRVFHRSGKVLDGRYHVSALTKPRQVRNAIAYVLCNIRKHYRQRNGHAPPVRIDPASSGRWFNGWNPDVPTSGQNDYPQEFQGPDLREVSPAQTWLLNKGWKQWGLIDPAEVPGGRKRKAA